MPETPATLGAEASIKIDPDASAPRVVSLGESARFSSADRPRYPEGSARPVAKHAVCPDLAVRQAHPEVLICIVIQQ